MATNDDRASDEVEVRAAGAILVDQAGRLAVVWRHRRNDWSLPKGKHNPGESDEQTALREVWEETGYGARIVGDLGNVRYRDHRDRSKTVRYFHMVVTDGDFVPNDEVTALEWLAPGDAMERLSYDIDRELVGRFASGND
jgi:8-oxo-dGTP diphosphatase